MSYLGAIRGSWYHLKSLRKYLFRSTFVHMVIKLRYAPIHGFRWNLKTPNCIKQGLLL